MHYFYWTLSQTIEQQTNVNFIFISIIMPRDCGRPRVTFNDLAKLSKNASTGFNIQYHYSIIDIELICGFVPIE